MCVSDAGSTMSESQLYVHLSAFSLSLSPKLHIRSHNTRKPTWIFFKFRYILQLPKLIAQKVDTAKQQHSIN